MHDSKINELFEFEFESRDINQLLAEYNKTKNKAIPMTATIPIINNIFFVMLIY